MIHRRPRLSCATVLFVWFCAWTAALSAEAGQWNVTLRSTVQIDFGPLSGIEEMSGVTYLGPNGALERFAAVQDTGAGLVLFDVGLSADGSINSTTAVSSLSLEGGLDADDYEGVSFTNAARNSVFVSEERTPDVSEYSLATGNRLQSVTLPDVFDDVRTNRGLESLTRSPAGDAMWTANEEALDDDGPLSTISVGTVVRLLRLDVNGNTVTAGPQYAYQVEPIHASGTPQRSGLSELVVLPDDSLMTLERSAAVALPAVVSRMFQVDFNGATDISDPAFDDGLDGEVYTTVSKTLLFSGSVGGVSGSGENLEGLSLGPQLPNGNWVLVGVADNGGGSSGNTVASFELAPIVGGPGDYDCSGTVDMLDYQLWKKDFGSTLLPFADGNGDGTVGAADYTVWQDHLGATYGAGTGSLVPLPEPSTATLTMLWTLAMSFRSRRHIGLPGRVCRVG